MTDADLDEDWSVPETAVMGAIRRTVDAGDRAVLATVVGVEGSAYRRPGAKMVVSESGAGVGSITAGCLEDEIRNLAASVREAGEPRVESFDLMADDDVWGLGLGCNGIIDLLFEPLDDRYRPVVDAYEDGRAVAVLTVLESDTAGVGQGDRLVAPGGDLGAGAADWPPWLVEALDGPVDRLLAGEQSETVTVQADGERTRVFVDAVTPPPELVIFGTGHDVGPVVELGRKLDFRVTVVGFRGGRATAERFPAADRVVSTSPAQVREAVQFDRDTYAVVMTHNFVDDRLVLDELLATEAPYVGLMGPQDRFEEMIEEFEAEGRTFSDADPYLIYTPIGLDLGSGTPHGIAMAIVGEVQAVASGREPKHLRERKSPIHERIDLDA